METQPVESSLGGGLLEKFSDSSRQAMSFVQEEAQNRNHGFIGTEHVILGLLRIKEIRELLQTFKISPEEVKEDTESTIGREEREVTGEITLTPRAKKIVELAVDEARQRRDREITPIHLFIGVLREGKGVAAEVLERQANVPLAILLDKVRHYKPAEKKDAELKAEAEREFVMESARRLEDFLADPANDQGAKVRIANILTELIGLAKKTEPESKP